MVLFTHLPCAARSGFQYSGKIFQGRNISPLPVNYESDEG